MTTPTTARSGAPGPAAGRWRLPVLVLLSVLLAAACAFLGWAVVERSGSDGGGVRLSADQSTGDAQTREEIKSRTQQFVLRMGSYGPEDLDDKGKMPGYRERVAEMLTTKFATSFEESVTVAEQMVAQFALVRKAEVFAVGVADVEDDSATALVAGAFTDKYGKAQADDPNQFRWEVRLVEVDGEWLVDDYTPVVGSAS